MSRLLHSTSAVRRMLRYIDWCILCGVIYASVPNKPISAVAAFPLLSANNRQELDGVTAVRRRGPHLDPWRCVGIVPAERFVKRVHVFLRLLLLIARRIKREVGTLLFAPVQHSKRTQKNKIHRNHLHIDKAHSEDVTHSNEERNTNRGRVARSSPRQHTTFTMSSRLINPNNQIAHDAVKCGSPDGPARRNLGWRSAGKRDRPASDATLARKIGERCASRRVQTCNNSEKRKSRTAKSDRVCSQWLRRRDRVEQKAHRDVFMAV